MGNVSVWLRRAIALGSWLVLCQPLVSCAGNIQAVVVDAQTGQPIPGAVVLGVWTKVTGLPGLTHTELVDVREVETDAAGRFTLERPPEAAKASTADESVTVYKFGYVAWNNLYVFPSGAMRKKIEILNQIRMQVFPKEGSHQTHMSFIRQARQGLYGIERIPIF
jgi:hypothetical protein